MNQKKNPKYIFFLILISLLWNCESKSKNDKLCEQHPKYYNEFRLPKKIIGYNNYQQGIDCSEKINKPLAVYFTANTCKKCREFEEEFLNSDKVSKLINKNYVFVGLFVDDKTELPSEDQFIQNVPNSDRKRRIKTIGQLNCTLLTKYHHSSQPTLFITDENESIVRLIGYNPNKEELIEELSTTIKK